MKISERDKFLLYLVVSILIVFLSYYFGFRSFTAKTEELNTEIAELRTKYNDLKGKEANAAQYAMETAAFELMYDALLSNYDSGFSQKATLLFTTELENQLDVWLRTVNMPDTSLIYTFGNVTSSNPSSGGGKVYTTDLKGYRKAFTYSYECSYDTFKEFLAYILDFDTRYTIDSVSCSYNEEEDLMSGSITVSQYAVTGSEREYYEPDIESIQTGTENLFVSKTNPNRVVETEDEFGLMTNYDIALSLSSEASDLSSVVLGRRGLVSSQVSYNSNEETAVVITVDGADGEYTISYSVGDSSYPAQDAAAGIGFNPGRTLDLIVFSSRRDSAEDLAGARVTIVNNSDMTFNIKVLNDDDAKPRFNVESTTGNIKFYK